MFANEKIHFVFFFVCLLNTVQEIKGNKRKVIMENMGITDIAVVEIPDNTKVVRLKENHIELVPANFFVNLSSIRTINLEFNDVNVIEDFAFKKVPSLKQIFLGNNNLTSITRYMFSGLFNLTTLDIEKNKISTIQDGSFFDFKAIQRLDIQENELETISSRVFDREDLPIELSLRIHSNPLICDWRLLGLYNAVHSGLVKLKNGALTKCQFQSEKVRFTSTTWGNITKTDLQAAGKEPRGLGHMIILCHIYPGIRDLCN